MNTQIKPNVLIVMLDTQRTDTLGCYGYDKPTTPNLDRLASEGAVFLDNISPAIWTLPSVASLFTGIHVMSHGAGAAYEEFDGTPATLAEALDERGYQSVAFFENHFAAMPRKGFNEFHLGLGMRHPGDYFDHSRLRIKRAAQWLDFNVMGQAAPAPFFMYVQFFDSHSPWRPREPYRSQFAQIDINEQEQKRLNEAIYPTWLKQYEFTDRDRLVLKSLYDASTACTDSHVGLLIDVLRDRGLLDNTVVFIMSDHGEMLGEHKDALSGHDHFTHHLAAYEELIKVVLIARYPATFPAGTRISTPTQTHDIVPTIAEILGFEFPQAQGFSLLGPIQGQPRRDFTLTEYQKSIHAAWRMLNLDPNIDPRVFLPAIKAWRRNGMKYIWRSDLRDELYDLRVDPKEQTNLIEQQPEIARAMRLDLENYCASLPVAEVGDWATPDRCPPELKARLQGMGWYREG